MEPVIRPVLSSEMAEFVSVARLGFGLPADFKVSLEPEWTMCAFIDGKLATSYGAWPLEMYTGGAAMPAGGITMVSTHPLYRRHNCLRKVTEAHFKRLHDLGAQPITILQASMAAIYQRYGYGIVSTKNSYSVEPRHINFVSKNSPEGRLREAQDSEIDSMVNIYNIFAAPRVGYLKRAAKMENAPGSFTVLKIMPPAIPMKLIYSESGQDLGYVVYSILRDASFNPMGQRITISDMAYLSPSAYKAIWSYFANMDLVSRIDWNKAPADDPLPHLMPEPRKLNITSADGLLGRLVDVEKALVWRRYSEQGILSFELIDDICEWNRGKWKLSAGASGNEIERTTGKVQLTLPVSTLAMLFFGQINATQAADMGRLEVHEPDQLGLWDKIMATTFRPGCTDTF